MISDPQPAFLTRVVEACSIVLWHLLFPEDVAMSGAGRFFPVTHREVPMGLIYLVRLELPQK